MLRALSFSDVNDWSVKLATHDQLVSKIQCTQLHLQHDLTTILILNHYCAIALFICIYLLSISFFRALEFLLMHIKFHRTCSAINNCLNPEFKYISLKLKFAL
jgi:hypothetical protein